MTNGDEKDQTDTGDECLAEIGLEPISTPRNLRLSPLSSFIRIERLMGIDNGFDGDTRERNPIISVSTSPKEPHLIATGGREGTVRLWVLEKSLEKIDPSRKEGIRTKVVKQVTTLLGHSGQVNAVRFSPNGEYLATCSADSSVRVYAGPNWKLAHSLRFHSLDVTDITWMSSSVLVSTSTDRNTIVWDATTGGRVQTLYSDKGSSCPKGVVSDPKGEYLIVLLDEGFMDVYRRNSDGRFRLSRHVDLSKEDIKNFSGAFKSTLYARRGSWSPHGEHLLLPLGARNRQGPCGVEYERYNLVEPIPGEVLSSRKIFLGHSSRIILVSVCPYAIADGEYISAMVSVDGVVSLWWSKSDTPMGVIANIASPMTVCTDSAWSVNREDEIISLFLSMSDGSVTLIELHNIGGIKYETHNTEVKETIVRKSLSEEDVKSAQVEVRVGGKRKIQPVVAFPSQSEPSEPSELKSIFSPTSAIVVKIDSARNVSTIHLNGCCLRELNGRASAVGHNENFAVVGLVHYSNPHYASICIIPLSPDKPTAIHNLVLIEEPASHITVTSSNLIGIIVGSCSISIWKLILDPPAALTRLEALMDDVPLAGFLRNEPPLSLVSVEPSLVAKSASGKQATFDTALRKWIIATTNI